MIAHLGTILPSIVKTQLDSPIVNWDFIGISAATEIYGGIFTLVLILCGIALLTGAVLLAFGKIGQHQGAFTAGCGRLASQFSLLPWHRVWLR
ncbi:hypothetical protein ACFOEP_12940 [Microbacterium amylolyticum]|uniref:hypothetical protein n=1 Tax=Microbacterium amylolyticum TaxID=936337 RepID=UPI003609AC7C